MTPPIADRLLATVLGRYPLSAPRVLEELEASTRNDNFIVEDAAGSRYMLRRFRRNPDQNRILFQLRFQQELSRLGYPTAGVIESASGELFVTEEESPWVLFAYIEGSELDFARMGQIEEAGRRLGEFHVLTQAIGLEDVAIDINVSLRRWWTHGEEDLLELREMFQHIDCVEEFAFLHDWHARILRAWPLESLERLPTGWVHADYHGRNILFVGDALVGLFDFDTLGQEILAVDLSFSLFMFGRESRLSRHIRPDAARRFLKEYGRIRPVAPEELAMFPLMMELNWAPTAPYYRMLTRIDVDPVGVFRHHVDNMRVLGAEMERLLPLLA